MLKNKCNIGDYVGYKVANGEGKIGRIDKIKISAKKIEYRVSHLIGGVVTDNVWVEESEIISSDVKTGFESRISELKSAIISEIKGFVSEYLRCNNEGDYTLNYSCDFAPDYISCAIYKDGEVFLSSDGDIYPMSDFAIEDLQSILLRIKEA